MLQEQIVIILPPIPKVLQPNCKAANPGMRMMESRVTKSQRSKVAAMVGQEECETLPWGHCTVSADMFFKTNRRRDEDNAMGSLKAVYDGIVDAGVVEDDTKKYMTRKMPIFHIDKRHPRVEITITRDDNDTN